VGAIAFVLIRKGELSRRPYRGRLGREAGLLACPKDQRPKSACPAIAAVFESHRVSDPIELPMATRVNPLTLMI
jgi:hypothetical protein